MQRQRQLANRAVQGQFRLLGAKLPLLQPLARLGIQGQGERIVIDQAHMAAERQIGHVVAQGELADVDALFLCRGGEHQLVDALDQLTLLITQPGQGQSFELDGEWQAKGGQRDGRRFLGLSGLAVISLFCLGDDRLLGADRGWGRLGRRLGGLGRLACLGLLACLVGWGLGRWRLDQGHIQAIEHGPAHDQPLAIQARPYIERLEGQPQPGHGEIQIRHLEAVDLDAQRQRLPDEGRRRFFGGRLGLRRPDHGMAHLQRLDPELALQQLAEIPIQHGVIDRDIDQRILPAEPFQGPAVAELPCHQFPLEGGQRGPGLLPQPLVARVAEAQQADADEQQKDDAHQP
ncbi:hypothetical protein D3C78_1046480 [compost metagenome]